MLNYIAAIALFVAPAIAAPWTNATCVDQRWSFNSQAQSPCLVGAYLATPCTTDDTFGIYSLQGTSGGPYGFAASAANNCLCNSVMWNLLSACALCQREPSGTWGQWVASCPTNMINAGKYPIPLPAGVSVPSWAYYDFTTAGVFNAAVASQQTGLESSAVSGATSTPIAVPSLTGAPSATPTEIIGGTSTPKPVKTQSGSNTGAIIGGVVGGVLGIGLIALIAFVLTRKRKAEDPAAKYPEANHKPPMAAQFNPVTPMTGQPSPYQFGAQPMSTPEHKPYDPSDPSTFPITPTNGHYAESIPYSYQPQGAPGQHPYPSTPQV
ncbi:unnamed protein product [Rhizoctonia solani]|uniref:Transmembrane protein n=1 Tax=Rhizoctonia solani TaxID=456999 RepID=A0A8H2XB66_9AGAM|nr:unnamed protein product [Rhizoctonia solani]